MPKFLLERTSRNAKDVLTAKLLHFHFLFLIKNYQHSWDLQKQSTKCVINTFFKEAPGDGL